MSENNVILSQEISELVTALKQVQEEIEALLSEKALTSELKTSFHKFEKLVSKTSEIEHFNRQLSPEERMELRAILSGIKTTFVKYQEKTGYVQNKGYPEKSADTLVRKTDFDMVVFGLEATGKKSFAKVISDDPDYKEFRKDSKFKFNINIIDDFGTLENICSSKGPFGLVNIVSYGYEFPKGLKYEDIVVAGKTLEDYLMECRRQEINLLKHFVTYLENPENSKNFCWGLTLIVKQDLWYKESRKVEKHYQEGEYKNIFEQIARNANRDFSYKCLGVCLQQLNVYSSDLKPIADVSSGYDLLIRSESLKNLFDTLESLTSNTVMI